MTPTTTWIHNLDPFLIRFTPEIGIRWYGLAYLLGFFIGALLIMFIGRRGKDSLAPRLVMDFITAVVLGTMIGGRLGYALFYAPELLTDLSGQFPFWGVLRVWEGGMASHGGILGIICASLYFAWQYRLDWRHLADLTTLGGSIGIFFGRIANFINGELFGRPVSSALPWAVKFPSEMYLWLSSLGSSTGENFNKSHLLQMTEAVSHIGVSRDDWQSWLNAGPGSSAGTHIHATIDRLIAAIREGNEVVRAAVGQHLTPRHPSQLYEAGLEGLLLFLIAFLFWRRPRRPGLVGVIWLMSYAIVRIIGEQFRMPDAHIGFQLWGLTRGQWLSAAMLIASAILAVLVILKPSEPMGGWGAKPEKPRI